MLFEISIRCDRPAAEVVVILAGTNDISSNTGPITLEGHREQLRIDGRSCSRERDQCCVRISDADQRLQQEREGEPIIRSVQRPPAQIAAAERMDKKILLPERKLVYLDYFSAMADEKGFLKARHRKRRSASECKGYELIKPLAENAIKTALKMKRPK
jgi:hypothetical protein